LSKVKYSITNSKQIYSQPYRQQRPIGLQRHVSYVVSKPSFVAKVCFIERVGSFQTSLFEYERPVALAT